MSRSQIEWLRNPITGEAGFSINPVKGLCPMACSYCYARRLYDRFRWNPEVRFDWSVANDLPKMKAGSKVFWGSTMELFGDWVDPEWMRLIFEAVRRHSDLTHIFLTKQPQNLPREFPDNCWVGVSATDMGMADRATRALFDIKASIKFLSLEPLLDWRHSSFLRFPNFLDWVIIGQQTPVKKATMPKIEWIQEIAEACDKAGIRLFEKNNLAPILGKNNLRQEFPIVKT